MKKLIHVLLTISLLFSIVACSSNPEKETKTNSSISEETIKEAASKFLAKDTQCTEELLKITPYTAPSVAVAFYDVTHDDQVEFIVMASQNGFDYTYMIYEYNQTTKGFNLMNYFTNNPIIDDGYPSYSITRDCFFTFSVVQNEEEKYDCLIDYWSNDEPLTAIREIYISNHSDNSYDYIVNNWEENEWVEEVNITDFDLANKWKEDAGEFVILSAIDISTFLLAYK